MATGLGWLEQPWRRSPTPVPSACLAAGCAQRGFLFDRLPCPDAEALRMLQGRGVAQPGAEQQRCCGVQGRHRGLQGLGMGNKDSTGTYLG